MVCLDGRSDQLIVHVVIMIDYGFWTVVVMSIVEIYGDFALRFYSQTGKLIWLLHGLVGYAGVVWLLIVSFKLKNVLYVNGMWDGVSGLVESIAAYVILGDRLEKPSQYTGLVMIIAGVFLLKNGF
jgi:multidrug transporter EmrE-like cation transporter